MKRETPFIANLSNEIQKDGTTYPNDAQIRLECLKLATVLFNVKSDSVNLATSVASEFYDWVIGKK